MNEQLTHWLEQARVLLTSNQVQVPPYRYTRPAPSRYEHQWLWDSCFHAMIYRHFDIEMARDELLCIAAGQVTEGDDAGMIPHMIYWRGGGADLWGHDTRSIITQPPLIAVAARLVGVEDNDTAWLETLYPALCAYHDWFDRRRDPDQDDLVCLIHPWESGWDSSPRWDEPMRLSADPSDDEAREARLDLVVTLTKHNCDPVTLQAGNYFCVEPADFNAIRAVDLDALGWIADQLGHTAEADRWRAKAQRVQQAIQSKMVQAHQVFDLNGADETPLTVSTAGEFVTLFGGAVKPETAEQLVERLQSEDYWPTYPVPTSAVTADLFRGNRYWRGNVWLNVNWLIWSGLRHYGYDVLAQQLTERSVLLASASGWHEYFHPHTGEGYGSFPHSWSAIILDMLMVNALTG